MTNKYCICVFAILTSLIFLQKNLIAEETKMKKTSRKEPITWQERAVMYARIMSRIKWTPVTEGMPIKGGGYFKKGSIYTGVPYSSVKHEGRYIGFDIFLKTFLAAVQNPYSVLYTENLRGKVKNAACYYGKVCSSYTSYALQCGTWCVSRRHTPPYRKGVALVESVQDTKVGDIIFTPPCPGSHVEIVTEVIKNRDGKITHVRVEDSYPETTRNIKRNIKNFASHISSRNKKLYHITDLNEWRENNRAEFFLFPNYTEDSATPVINHVLLLDRGDWVPYYKGEAVKINIMDKKNLGINKLIIKRNDTVIEEIERPGKGVIKRSFSICGDYTVHCVMSDGSLSQACEFAVCNLDFSLPIKEVHRGQPWEIKFTSDNMKIRIIYLYSDNNKYGAYNVFTTEKDRQKGKIVIPGDLIQDSGNLQVWVMGENKYGRLKKRQDIIIKD